MAVGLLGIGCTLLLDPDRLQCVSDSDCERRGGEFAGTACVESYCRAVSADGAVVGVGCDVEGDCDESETCDEGVCRSVSENSECSISDDCELGQRCENNTCEGTPDPDWACVRDAFAMEAEEVVQLAVPVVSVLDFSAPLPEIEARLCPTLDRFCDIPRDRIASNADGLFQVTLPSEFTGYLEIAAEGFDPTLYFFPPRRWAGVAIPAVLLAPVEVGGQILQEIGAVSEPQRGHVFITVHNCHGEPAAGVQAVALAADSRTIPYYVAEAPVRGLTQTVAGRGVAGFVNLEVGSNVVSLFLADTGQILGQVTFIIRAGLMNQAAFVLPRD